MKRFSTIARIYYSLLIIILIMVSMVGNVHAQSQEQGFPFIRNYNSREYLASSANYTVVQDQRGLMYFGNYRGVLEYDGTDWRLIPVSNHSMVRNLAIDSAGTIYIGALGEFGYLAPDSTGKLEYISLVQFLDESTVGLTDVVKVIGLEKGAIFQSTGQGTLYFWKEGKIAEYTPPELLELQSLGYYYGSLMAVSDKKGLVEWSNGQFSTVPGGEKLIGRKIVEMIPFPGKRLLAKSLNGGFLVISPPGAPLELEPFETEIDDEIAGNMFSKLIPVNHNHFLVGTVKNGGYLINHQGKLLMQINETSGLQDNLILGGVQDKGKSLWLTLSKGISRIEISSPISYWDDAAGLRGIVYSSIRHDGILYASTPLGVFYLNNGEFLPVKGLGIESWKLFPFEITKENGSREKKLLVATVRGLYEIKNDYAVLIDRDLKLVNIYQSPFQPQRIYNISGSKGVQIIDYRQGQWKNVKQIKQLDGRYKSISEDRNGNLWLVELQEEGGLIRASFSDQERLNISEKIHFKTKFDLPPMLAIYHLDDDLIFSSTSGLIRYDQIQNHFYSDTVLNLSPRDGFVTKLVKDYQEEIWLERQKNTRSWVEILTKNPDGGYVRDTTKLKGLANSEVWGNIYPEANGLTWIGTTEGLFVFNKNIQKNFGEMATPLIREVILAEDSTLFHGGFPPLLKLDSLLQEKRKKLFWSQVPKINYKFNSITFHYSAPYFEEEKGIMYSYLLKGLDDEWSPWNGVHKKDYNSLPPGKYEFLVKAKNVYGKISQTACYPFDVSPPWYRTYWAFISYGFLVLFLIYGTVKLNTQRLHLQNEHLERIVYERTAEIWEQHKEIVKKTVALKRQKEEIATQHGLLEEKNEALEATLQQLKEAQSQLVESEKMASLGQLTAGIAHEINNPINYVKGNISPLKRDFDELKPLLEMLAELDTEKELKEGVKQIKEYYESVDAGFLLEEMSLLLNGIEEGAIRTKEIVDGLKLFSRSDTDTFKHIDIHTGLDATLTILANKVKDRIQIERNYADLPVIECRPGKINQVFMNILTNGIQAIESHRQKQPKSYQGVISISTEETPCEVPGKGKCVLIRIKDNGGGISKEFQSRIFDPFFTTKEVGEGTGLGLSISFGIIENHQGNIKVNSNEKEGTEFIITLPYKQS